LLDNEMQWTVQYFLYKSCEWADVHRKLVFIGVGPAAFASRQASQWKSLAERCQETFAKNNKNYVRINLLA